MDQIDRENSSIGMNASLAHAQRSKWAFPVSLAFLALMTVSCPESTFGIGGKKFVEFASAKGSFSLSVDGKSAPLCVSSADFPGVRDILEKFQADIEAVTGAKPEIVVDSVPATKEIVIVGTLGKNPLFNSLVSKKKLDVKSIQGKWESFLVQSVEKPFGDVDRALLIVGGDKRGTIYGMFEISEQIGVSPWYW